MNEPFRIIPIPIAACPACGSPLDGSSPLNSDLRPAPGHGSICGRCGALSVFGEGLSLRELTPEELETLSPELSTLLQRVEGARIAARRLPPALASLVIHAAVHGRSLQEALAAADPAVIELAKAQMRDRRLARAVNDLGERP